MSKWKQPHRTSHSRNTPNRIRGTRQFWLLPPFIRAIIGQRLKASRDE